MRGRHTFALYKKMEYETLVAKNKEHYIELAVRLATDVAWREDQRKIIAQRKGKLAVGDEGGGALAGFIRATVSI
jgi:predicted O-linked N-acetylglucosamine transferase (SPINDLY family)